MVRWWIVSTVEHQGKYLGQSKITTSTYRNLNIPNRVRLTLHNLSRLERLLNRSAQHSSQLFATLHTRRILALLAVWVVAIFLSACSSPPVAEFNATTVDGNAPLEVSFLLGELADADEFSWDFGDGVGSQESEPTHVFEFAGDFVVTLTAKRGGNVSTAEQLVSVEPGEAGWVVIEGDNSATESFETTTFTAQAFDVLGNPISDANFDWSVDETAGWIDEFGVYTAGTELGTYEDAITVEFERLGVRVSDSIGTEIVTGPLHAFSVAPSEIDLQVGRSEQLTVEAIDEAGHVLDSALVLFTALRDGDTVDSSGLFVPGLTASDENVDLLSIEVEVDGSVIETTVSGTIRPGILDQIHVSSLPTTLEVGESFQLVSFATDRFGNELKLDASSWSVSDPSIGSITDNGMFTAGTTAGEYSDVGITAKGELNGVESVAIAPVTIVPGPATAVHVVPDNDSVPIGAGSPFVVLATDEHGNIIDIAEEDFVYEYSSAGRGNEPAVFISGYEIGHFEDAITVTLPAGIAGNDTDLVVQSDINIRQRSSNIIAVEVVDQDGGGIFFIDLETAQIGPADNGFRENGAIELSPAWWPDGSRLVYISDASGELQVYTLDLDSRDIVQLTDVTGGVSMADISRDGESIVFVSLAEDQWQLYVAVIPEDVGDNPITLEIAQKISVDEDSQHILPYWSPDGSTILATQNHLGNAIRVMQFDPEGESQPVVLGPLGSIGFGWTSDGSGVHVGFDTGGGALDIGTLNLDSSDPVFIESNLQFLVASWSPDDSEIVAIDSLLGAGWLVDSDGSSLRRVIDAAQVPTRMSWRPREYGDPVAVPEFEGEPKMLQVGDDLRAPIGALDTSLDYTAVMTTDAGVIELELFDDVSPMTVENFVNLARTGFYEGLEFHRVIAGFVSQGGDPDGDGRGGPGYTFNDEFSRELSHDGPGVLSMANAGSNTNGSQFFITHAATTWLDAFENGVAKNCADDNVSCHSIFGRVISGLEIVTGMSERDPETATIPGVKILSISIIES